MMPAPRNEGPRFFAWLIAAFSLVLPAIGAVLAYIGADQLYRRGPYGWLLWAGAGAFILDLAIDVWWAHPAISESDEPDLNARGAQLIGRLVIVEQRIENGRGKVRVGDTLWAAEGTDCPAGTEVRVTGVQGTALIVDCLAQR